MSHRPSASIEASCASSYGKPGRKGERINSLSHQEAGSTFPQTAMVENNVHEAVKRKRNLSGSSDPETEVIALSPKTLLATNRFICEICSKGFPRDQNLQLHRRGHSLPWKLRQRTSKENRKRVYVCPEISCVHHDPSRALGDLTGIKKHFSRKHGEKIWKCDKCSKRYAVQSDWKAHSKTCGTREYWCDCGTLFSRRDTFITHRAFCSALAEETARVSATIQARNQLKNNLNTAPPDPNALSSPNLRLELQRGDTPKSGETGFPIRTADECVIVRSCSARMPLWPGDEPSNTENQMIGGSQQLQAGGSPYPYGFDAQRAIFVSSSNSLQGFSGTMISLHQNGQKSFPCQVQGGSSNPGNSYSVTHGTNGSSSVMGASTGITGLEMAELRDAGNHRNWYICRTSSPVRIGLWKRDFSCTVNSASFSSCSHFSHPHSAQLSSAALHPKVAQMDAAVNNPPVVRGLEIAGSNTMNVGKDQTGGDTNLRTSCSLMRGLDLPVNNFRSRGNKGFNELIDPFSALSSDFCCTASLPPLRASCLSEDMQGATFHSLENGALPNNIPCIESLRYQHGTAHEYPPKKTLPGVMERLEDGSRLSDTLTRDFLGIERTP